MTDSASSVLRGPRQNYKKYKAVHIDNVPTYWQNISNILAKQLPAQQNKGS